MLWEREPLVATRHFQDPENIPEPRGTDIVVVILWSRLGLPLPADKFRGAISGRCPVTGTEWEFEDGLAGAREHGVPELLLYRKAARITADLGASWAAYFLAKATALSAARALLARWGTELPAEIREFSASRRAARWRRSAYGAWWLRRRWRWRLSPSLSGRGWCGGGCVRSRPNGRRARIRTS